MRTCTSLSGDRAGGEQERWYVTSAYVTERFVGGELWGGCVTKVIEEW